MESAIVKPSLCTELYGIIEMVNLLESIHYSQEARERIYQSILIVNEEWLKRFKEQAPLVKKFKVEDTTKNITEEETKEEKVEEEKPLEQPKRRGRPKKTEKVEVEPEPEPEPEPEEKNEQPSRAREINFDSGLEKGLAAYSTIEGVTDDTIVNEKLGPIPLANSLPKQGEHPFFKGPAQFVWYLDMERWPMYLANLLENKEFYPDQLSLYDAKRFEEAKRVGVDIEFVTALVDKETKRMVSIEDFKEADYADDEKGMEALMELKDTGFLKKFVAEIDPEKKLLKFLTRFGQNKHIAEDLQTIYEEHTEHPNKYIHW